MSSDDRSPSSPIVLRCPSGSDHQFAREPQEGSIRGSVPLNAADTEAFVAYEVRKYCVDHLDERLIQEVVTECLIGLHKGVTEREAVNLITLALRSRVERDPVYSFLAARLVCSSLYKDILGVDEFAADFTQRYRVAFAKQLAGGVALGILDPRLESFDLDRLSKAIVPKRDQLLKYMGVQMLYDRFFAKGPAQQRLETPQHFWMRISMGLALPEADDVKDEFAVKFYDAMSMLRCMPSTSPTLYHVGTLHPQTGCYVLAVRDDLQHVFKTISTDAEIASLSAGFGNDWTEVRGTCALETGQITGQGPIPFLKVLDSSVAAFNRSGRRHSAACAYLETWHYDIEDFLSLRRTTGDHRRRVYDISTANWIPDLFMKRVAANSDWTLFSPDEAPDLHTSVGRDFERRYEEYESKADRGEVRVWKRLRARDLWRQMVTRLFETGHPWMTFKDACNLRSSQDHIGPVRSANLCTEIILNASPDGVGVSTLGSVNLARHVEDGRIDWGAVAESVRMGIRMLDNALDVSEYPSWEIGQYALQHRPVGLGVMGFQDALYEMGVHFDSEAGCSVSDRLMEFISYHAILASAALAEQRGAYESFAGSKWDRGIFPVDTLDLLEKERGVPVEVDRETSLDWSIVREEVKSHGMRNCNVVAVAPTQTLANIAGCFPSIEPPYKQIYVKSNSSGDFGVLNEYLARDLKDRGLWSDELVMNITRCDGSVQEISELPDDVRRRYRGAFEIHPMWVVDHAAKRGKWVDQGQSINIFIDSEDGGFISDIYMQVWRMGIKTTYYLKILGASTIEKSTVTEGQRNMAGSI